MGGVRFSRSALAAFCAFALALPAGALAAFPGSNPDESPRANTPNDPDFDDCELDDEQGGTACSYFEEEYRLFGFSPDTANLAPLAPPELHPIAATPYIDCTQLDAQGQRGEPGRGRRPVLADRRHPRRHRLEADRPATRRR